MGKAKCKSCRSNTPHWYANEEEEVKRIQRCSICGQRPDRPRDGTEINTTCTSCGEPAKAFYCDDDCMDAWIIECKDCGDLVAAFSECDPHQQLIVPEEVPA